MIRTEDITELPKDVLLSLRPYSAEEYRQVNKLPRSQIIRLVREDEWPLLVYGIDQPNFLSQAELWFLLCTHFKLRHLRRLCSGLRDLLEQYPRIITPVEVGFITGEKFIRFVGFQPLDRIITIQGRQVRLFEARL